MMPDIPLPVMLTAAGVLAAAALLAWAYRREFQQRQDRAQELLLAGFQPLTEPPPGLAQRVAKIGSLRKEPLLRDVQRQHGGDCDIFIFQLVHRDSQGNEEYSDQLLGVSARLSLPRLHIIPRPWIPGAFGRLAGPLFARVAGWAASRKGLSPVTVPDDARFAAAFMVFSDEPDKAAAALSGGRARWLAELPGHCRLDVCGDCFSIRPYDTKTGSRSLPVAESLASAMAVYKIFSR